MAKDKELALAASPMEMLNRMIDHGVNPDALSKMMDLAARWQADEAKKLYTAAIVAFKDECPSIVKRNAVRKKGKEVNGEIVPGDVMYRFASYEDIKEITVPLEKKNRITTSFDFEVTPAGNLTGTLLITVGSHTETRRFGIPIPAGMNTNKAQDFGAAMTYLRRYLYCAAFDIVISGEDKDGAGFSEKITEEQIGIINDLFVLCEKAGKPVPLDKFKAWAEIDDLSELAPSKFESAVKYLKSKAGAK